MQPSVVRRPAPRFGPFLVTRELARGGMGVVYEARHPGTGEGVAVKALPAMMADDPVAVTRFEREAAALRRIRHPNLVRLLDAGVQDGAPFLVMELLEGETLERRLARRGPLDSATLAGLLLPVLSAVAALHRHGLVHRDLKPANVLLARCVRRRCRPVLLDLGLCRPVAVQAGAGVTRSEILLGTPQCLAPEQIWDARLATPLSDQYALGVMLYWCAAGRPPFAGESLYPVMHAILHEPLPPPSRWAAGVPAALDRLILRAMSRERAARFPDVAALRRALRELAR